MFDAYVSVMSCAVTMAANPLRPVSSLYCTAQKKSSSTPPHGQSWGNMGHGSKLLLGEVV